MRFRKFICFLRLLQPDKGDDVQSVDVLAETCLTTEHANAKLDEILSCVKDIQNQVSMKQSNQRHVLPPIAQPDDIP